MHESDNARAVKTLREIERVVDRLADRLDQKAIKQVFAKLDALAATLAEVMKRGDMTAAEENQVLSDLGGVKDSLNKLGKEN